MTPDYSASLSCRIQSTAFSGASTPTQQADRRINKGVSGPHTCVLFPTWTILNRWLKLSPFLNKNQLKQHLLKEAWSESTPFPTPSPPTLYNQSFLIEFPQHLVPLLLHSSCPNVLLSILTSSYIYKLFLSYRMYHLDVSLRHPAQSQHMADTQWLIPEWISKQSAIEEDDKLCFPRGTVAKNPPANAGDVGLIPGSGRSPRLGNGKSVQYSCLENSIGRRAWRATVHGPQRVRHNRVPQQARTCQVLAKTLPYPQPASIQGSLTKSDPPVSTTLHYFYQIILLHKYPCTGILNWLPLWECTTLKICQESTKITYQ